MVNGWDAYVTGKNGFVGRGGIEKGGIFGQNDGKVWAEVKLSKISSQEVLKIVETYNGDSSAFSNGIYLEGERYTLLRMDPFDGFIQARSTNEDGRSVSIVQTKQAIFVAISECDGNGGSVSVTLGKVVDYVRKQGF